MGRNSDPCWDPWLMVELSVTMQEVIHIKSSLPRDPEQYISKYWDCEIKLVCTG